MPSLAPVRPAPGSGPPKGEQAFDRLSLWQNAWRLALVWVFALGWTLAVYTPTLTHPELLRDEEVAFALVLLDVVVAHLILGWVAFRRRWPAAVALISLALSTVSPMSVPIISLAILSLGTRRRMGPLLGGAVVNGLAGLLHERLLAPWVFPQGSGYTVGDGAAATLLNQAVALLYYAVVALIGWNVGSRRELVRSWRTQAETATSEQAARVAQAQLAERARIAREMHDVLAHRLSLVAMHAGVLAHRTDLTESERQEAAEVVRAGAHQALQELREVLGVLREDVEASAGPDRRAAAEGRRAGARVEAPQPGLSGIPSLVAEVTSSGHQVDLQADPELWPRSVTLPTSTGRHAYRVVQEALTNARKHAPGVALTVTMDGEPGEGLTITTRNAVPRRRREDGPGLPSGGLGLTGMAERVELAGGRFDAGPQPGGDFVVRAWLPWPHPGPGQEQR